MYYILFLYILPKFTFLFNRFKCLSTENLNIGDMPNRLVPNFLSKIYYYISQTVYILKEKKDFYIGKRRLS